MRKWLRRGERDAIPIRTVPEDVEARSLLIQAGEVCKTDPGLSLTILTDLLHRFSGSPDAAVQQTVWVARFEVVRSLIALGRRSEVPDVIDLQLVPRQATFARFTSSRSDSSRALRFRQAM